MKRIGIAVVLFSSFCYAESSDGFEPASTNVWGAAYPRVDASGKAEFRIKAPEAAKVRLNFWGNVKIDMVKQPDGFWTATTAPLVPGFHYYTILIDGAEFSDPGSHSFFGGGKDASAIEIPEPDPLTICLRTFRMAMSVRFGTSPKSPVRGGMPSSICRRATTRRPRRDIPRSIFNTAAAKTRPAGSSRATPTSSSTI